MNEMYNSSHTAIKIMKSRDWEAWDMGPSRLTHLLILVLRILVALEANVPVIWQDTAYEAHVESARQN
jgi:hypothetical protein